MLAVLTVGDYLFLLPICFSIAVVTSAAHRDDMREIFRHSIRSWFVLLVSIVVFTVALSFFFEWILPR
jgi:hypothetical protein